MLMTSPMISQGEKHIFFHSIHFSYFSFSLFSKGIWIVLYTQDENSSATNVCFEFNLKESSYKVCIEITKPLDKYHQKLQEMHHAV